MFLIRDLLSTISLLGLVTSTTFASLQLNDLDYFESPGFDALVYSNKYNGNFDDSKMAGVEFIHHGIRTVTNGDVRLRPTPDQWDEIGQFVERKVDRETGTITAYLSYPKYDFDYRIVGRTEGDQLLLSIELDNPFGVIITRGGWAGNGFILRIAINQYLIHKTFPELADRESVFKGLNYFYGFHPDSSVSFVSGVGFKSKQVAYGSNRADFSFIAGGIVPGILVLPPDYPENREDWPFLWGENEYVISMGAPYIYLVHAVQELPEEE